MAWDDVIPETDCDNFEQIRIIVQETKEIKTELLNERLSNGVITALRDERERDKFTSIDMKYS